jgi:uncharacterized protein YndB with AHSA1/START domain
MTGSEQVRREIVLPAECEEVWSRITRSEHLSAWFEGQTEIDARPRGAITVREPGGAVRRGTVLAASRPYRLVVVWENGRDEAGHEVGPSRMEFTLEAVPEGTRLTVIEATLSSSAPERFFLEAVG